MLSGVWRQLKAGRVQHYIVRGLDDVALACAASYIDAEGFFRLMAVDESNLFEAPALPKCKRCLRTRSVLAPPSESSGRD